MLFDAQHRFLGIDLGTSGCRAHLIDIGGHVSARSTVPFITQPTGPGKGANAQSWWEAVNRAIRGVVEYSPAENVVSLTIDGTSGTILLVDRTGVPLGYALMYDDDRARDEAREIQRVAPPNSGAHGPSSGLSKLLWLTKRVSKPQIGHCLNQADWIMGRLLGQFGISDENNCLKLGYDPENRCWPDWLDALNIERSWLPKVLPAGTYAGTIDPLIAVELGLPEDTNIVTGTTDSLAGFIATGATEPGEAVTSLGSTLVLKVVAEHPVFASEYGVYSHRLRHRWLVGGASNSGGAVLREFFTQSELDTMTRLLKPHQPTGLDYYPLLKPGERFPHADPHFEPRLDPRTDDPVRFYQGLLEGIASIERRGYERLESLGAPYPTNVRTVGGGADNAAWTTIRQRYLGVDVFTPGYTEAAYGAAILARDGILADQTE